MAESPAAAAFRELLALNKAAARPKQPRPPRPPSPRSRPAAAAAAAAAATATTEGRNQQPTLELQELLLALGDGTSSSSSSSSSFSSPRARRSALTGLRAWLLEQQQQQQRSGDAADCQRVFQESFPAVLRCIADASEACREGALQVFGAFLGCRGVDVAPSLPRLFAILTSRLPPGLHHDADAGLFIYDADAHDGHRRGKAVLRQDKGGHPGHASAEPSEAVRLASLQVLRRLLQTIPAPACGDVGPPTLLPLLDHAHFHGVVLFAQHHLRDVSPDVRIEACHLLTDLARAPAYEFGANAYALALFRALLPSLRQPLARVRAAALGALGAIVAVPDRAKCKGAASGAIEELVGFRPDNVLSVAAFYRPEVDVNYLAEASVRIRLLEVLRDWLLRLPDRRAHDARLVPYLLTLLNDPVQEGALAALVACGEQYLAEERARRQAQSQQTDLDDTGDNDDHLVAAAIGLNHRNVFPFDGRRPPLAARLYVRSATARALPVVAEELTHWTPATRLHSAQLLRTLIFFHEHHALSHLHLLLPAIVRGLQVDDRGSEGTSSTSGGGGGGGESGAGPALLDCARMLGPWVEGAGIVGQGQAPDKDSAFVAVVEGLLANDGGIGGASASRRRAVSAVRSALGLAGRFVE